jgi:hypothetical protein
LSHVELMGTIVNKATIKAAWVSLYLWNISTERMHKVRASTLRCELDALKIEDGETIDDFGVCINNHITQLAILGTNYIDEEIVRRFLQVLLARLDQITTSIETLLNLAVVSLDELIG